MRAGGCLCATLIATRSDNTLVFLWDCLAFLVCTLARNLDTDAGDVFENVEFLDPHPGFLGARILQAETGNLLGEGFDKVEMSGGGDFSDTGDNCLITDDVFDPVFDRGGVFINGKVHIHPDTLGAPALVMVHPDLAGKDEVANEDAAKRFFRFGGGAGANEVGL